MKKRVFHIFTHFFNSGKTGSILLMLCLLISLVIANSSLEASFTNFLNWEIGNGNVKYSIYSWINDGLMSVFFLLVGLEIKRELLDGELSSLKKASLPVLAALGGILVPAGIYFLFNHQTPTAHGWGIPMATDIAFALAIFSLLGSKVPSSLKIFLAALAIVDDLGAILVIAIFYTQELHWQALMYALAMIIILFVLNFYKIRNLWIYLLIGMFLWYFMHHSGIHATIAGVILAFAIPYKKIKHKSPLLSLEHRLIKPVNFLIMPLFALANTNISFNSSMTEGIFSDMGLGIILGLFLGKPIGISIFSYVAVKLKWANLPNNSNWKHIIGIGVLAGIGFTMSIFIAMLSFNDLEHINTAKFAILIASCISGFIGYLFLSYQNKFNISKK